MDHKPGCITINCGCCGEGGGTVTPSIVPSIGAEIGGLGIRIQV